MRSYLRRFFFGLFFTAPLFLLAQVEPDTLLRRPQHLLDVDTVSLTHDLIKLADSIVPDTTQQSVKPDREPFTTSGTLEEIVDTDALDSIVTSMKKEKTFLYNEAVVVYGDITLKAGYIEIDNKTNEVLATGVVDSLGEIVQKPIFIEGGKEYRTDTIRYNFDTGKAKIKMLLTQEGEAFMQGQQAKKMDEDILYLYKASYTTCSHEQPHFRIMTTKTKVIPNDRIITGPAYLEVLDLPTPLMVPFGFMPTQEERTSGILIPAYGSSLDRGHFLRGGGFYLSISDYWDYTIRTDLFTRGGYGLFNNVNYAQRYKFRGQVNIDYNRIVIGRPEFEGYGQYQNSSDFSVRWNHQQDPKANPNLQFSANVNVATQSFNQLATQDPMTNQQNQLQSSVNLNKSFAGKPYTLSVQAGHNQSNATGTLNLDLPTVNFNMNRIFPFKKKTFTGKEAWYEKIGIQYQSNFKNTIETTLDDFQMDPNFLANESRNGVRHNIPINANYRIFKHFTLTPSVNFTQRWYLNRMEYQYSEEQITEDSISYGVESESIPGFYTPSNYQVRADLTTKIYGMWAYKRGPVQAMRHVITPSVGVSYAPDFADAFWGAYQEVQVNPEGDTELRHRFQGNEFVFGGLQAGRQGNLNFRLDNVLEGKLKAKNDTTEGQKIKFLEGLSIQGSYNLAAEELQWSQVRITARTSVLKGLISFNYNTAFDPYAANDRGVRINELNINANGRLLRPVNSQFNVSTSLNNKTFGVMKQGGGNPAKQPPVDPAFDPLNVESGFGAYTTGDPNYHLLNYYVDYTSTWNLRLNYVVSSQIRQEESIINQTFDFSGDIQLSGSWRIGFSSGYDIQNSGFSYTSLDFYKDLHCWELNCRWIPFGVQQSYFLSVGVKAPMFQDLKLERQRGIGDFGQTF